MGRTFSRVTSGRLDTLWVKIGTMGDIGDCYHAYAHYTPIIFRPNKICRQWGDAPGMVKAFSRVTSGRLDTLWVKMGIAIMHIYIIYQTYISQINECSVHYYFLICRQWVMLLQ